MISCIYAKEDEKIPCVVNSISVDVNNKLQVQNSSDKGSALIIRTGNWTRRLNLTLTIRDDLKLIIENTKNSDGTNGKKVSIGCNDSPNFLTELEKKMDFNGRFLANKLKQFLVSFLVFDMDEESEKTIDLTRTIMENFAEKTKVDEIKAKLINMVVDDISFNTDETTNVTTLNISGSFKFFGKFAESDFLQKVVGDK